VQDQRDVAALGDTERTQSVRDAGRVLLDIGVGVLVVAEHEVGAVASCVTRVDDRVPDGPGVSSGALTGRGS